MKQGFNAPLYATQNSSLTKGINKRLTRKHPFLIIFFLFLFYAKQSKHPVISIGAGIFHTGYFGFCFD
ncbi:hypothetical protein JCM15548_13692 [Geofilum rubicundum JCM 15548]|uniref:Uncharacterized protein n=1 Tax=Geofilum rubicundum JCM 15548 TaxID=1236989 RepID=A0A0E9M1T6_9BACT|nr:hypothetical protein JCM15548_13692 [Geofilum rubicundum JCM 15548]